MEKELYDNGITRPTYHGGDFSGVTIKDILQVIDVLFNVKFKNLILAVTDREADDEEVNMMMEMYSHLGILLDGVFSLARTRCGDLDESKISLTKRMIEAVLIMWRNLRFSMRGTKIHGLEDHVVQQMELYNGIGDFLEDFVEQSHQDGIRDELRTRNLERSKAYVSHSRWEWKNNTVKIQEAKNEVKIKTSRKRKRGVVQTLHNKKIGRDEKRMASLAAVESGRFTMIQDYKLRCHERDNDDSDDDTIVCEDEVALQG